jgi:hypothetical protein
MHSTCTRILTALAILALQQRRVPMHEPGDELPVQSESSTGCNDKGDCCSGETVNICLD